MSNLVEIIEALLLTPPAASEAETMSILRDVAGRGPGQYGAWLKEWLESDLGIYPEPVTVQLIDNPAGGFSLALVNHNPGNVEVVLRPIQPKNAAGRMG